MSADEQTVLTLIADVEDGIITAPQVRAATQWSNSRVGRVLKGMSESEPPKVTRTKVGKGAFVYSL